MGAGTLGRLPIDAIQRVVGAHLDTYTVTRVTETVNDLGEIVTTETEFNRSLWCYTPSQWTQQYYGGERTSGDLMALTLPTEDIQLDDRLTHAGIEYEVSAQRPLSEHETTLVEYTLVRRNGPQS